MNFFCYSILAFTLTVSAHAAFVVSTKGPATGKEDKRVVVAADLPGRAAVIDFGGQALPWKKATSKFTITRRDPVFAFDEGRAYFKIVALPKYAVDQKLELRSYYSTDFPTTLFVPGFVFLDSARQAVAKDAAPEYKIVNGFGEHIRVAVGIPVNSAFVVIFTTPARVAERMTFQTSTMTGVVPSPTFSSKDTGFSGFYEGILKLELTKK